ILVAHAAVISRRLDGCSRFKIVVLVPNAQSCAFKPCPKSVLAFAPVRCLVISRRVQRSLLQWNDIRTNFLITGCDFLGLPLVVLALAPCQLQFEEFGGRYGGRRRWWWWRRRRRTWDFGLGNN